MHFFCYFHAFFRTRQSTKCCFPQGRIHFISHFFHGIHDLILIQEALQEKKIAEIAGKIAENPDKKIVMIAGPSSSGGANGYITSYDLYVKKAESDDWTQVVTDGVWASDTKEKTAKFNTVDARYIKFVAKEGSNGFATASEFHIHQVLNEEEQEVTKAQEALNEAVNDSSIKGIYEAGNADGTYTSASWTAFKEAYEAAKAPSEGASAEELKTLLTNLQSAKAGLKNAAVESAKETLKAEVDKAENKNIYEAGNADGTYTKDSWTAFKEA